MYTHCECFVLTSLLLSSSVNSLVVLSVGSIVLLMVSMDLLFCLKNLQKILPGLQKTRSMFPFLFLSCNTLEVWTILNSKIKGTL